MPLTSGKLTQNQRQMQQIRLTHVEIDRRRASFAGRQIAVAIGGERERLTLRLVRQRRQAWWLRKGIPQIRSQRARPVATLRWCRKRMQSQQDRIARRRNVAPFDFDSEWNRRDKFECDSDRRVETPRRGICTAQDCGTRALLPRRRDRA